MAEHYTTNLGLAYPDPHTTSWNGDVEANYALLDATPTVSALAVRQAEFPSTTRNINVAAGTFRKSDGTAVAVAAVAGLALSASATHYVYADEAGVVSENTTGFPATAIVPLATVVVGASTITSIADRRVALFAFGPVAGGTAASGLAVTTSESPSTTLHVDIADGTFVDVGGAPGTTGGLGVLMLASADNYIYWSELVGLVVNGVAFPANQNLVRIAVVTTDATKVTDIVDARIPFVQAGGHVVGRGATPSIAAGSGAGTSPTVTIAGSDTAGTITVLTGTSPGASSVVATVTFGSNFHATPRAVLLTPAEVNAGSLSGVSDVFVNAAGTSVSQWSFRVGSTALAATTTHKWHYLVIG